MDEINPAYSNKKVIAAIKEKLEKKSSVQLRNFLTPQAYCLAMKTTLLWRKYVPDKYSFHERKSVLPLFLSFIMPGRIHMSLRVFEHHDYILLHDHQDTSKGYDMLLDLQDMDESWGGWSSYVHHNIEIARVIPLANTLTIVRREKNTFSFVKYVNHHALNSRRMFFARVTFK